MNINLGDHPDLLVWPIIAEIRTLTLHQNMNDDRRFILCNLDTPYRLPSTLSAVAEFLVTQVEETRHIHLIQIAPDPYWSSDLCYSRLPEKFILYGMCNLGWNDVVIANDGSAPIIQTIRNIGDAYNNVEFDKFWYDPNSGSKSIHCGFDIPSERKGHSILISKTKPVKPLISTNEFDGYPLYYFNRWLLVYHVDVPPHNVDEIFRIFDFKHEKYEDNLLPLLEHYGIKHSDCYKIYELKPTIDMLPDGDKENSTPSPYRIAIMNNGICVYGENIVRKGIDNGTRVQFINIQDGPWPRPVSP